MGIQTANIGNPEVASLMIGTGNDCTADNNTEIYVMNADGSGQTRLTNNPGLDNAPAWSPE
jgi:hypothetical protein